MKNKLTIIAIAIFAITLTNCKKDTKAPEPQAPPVATPTGSLNVFFEAMVGDSDLVFNTETYTNQIGNAFNVTKYKYIISNIKLVNADNSIWTEPNSYHLIDHSNPSSVLLNIANVPFGNYKSMEFMIGVDSARNNSGAQTGALDVSNDMYWSWNSGYIMAKFEGTSPQSTALANKLIFHIGGFSGANKVMRIVSPTFNNDTAKVTSTFSPTIHMASDLLEWFKTPALVDFSTLNTIHMEGVNAKTIANNYSDMFTVEHIHNN